jgi:SAM-dependent methyltransferase
MIRKRPLGAFLRTNPFPNGLTDGLFYREKMRAIHRIAPQELAAGVRILEIGGGRSGMAASLFPGAHIVSLDIDPGFAAAQPGGSAVEFVTGDACDLPFPDDSFDIVTMFDVLEHIPDDKRAAAEARRVAKAGGQILVSTPRADWHYPYYPFMARFCPPEQALMDEWGHVRRGYTQAELDALFAAAPAKSASFINGATAFFHDVAFSNLGPRKRKLLYALAAVPTAAAYVLHGRKTRGTEIAAAWQC